MSPVKTVTRCSWCGTDPLYVAYHDEEWGVPERDSRALFEKLLLDGFQAGLAWITILRKRDGFRAAFDGFDPANIARYGDADRTRLMDDPGIVRNRAKIEASVVNARAYLELRIEAGFRKPSLGLRRRKAAAEQLSRHGRHTGRDAARARPSPRT